MTKHQVVVLSDIHIGDDSPNCWYQASIHEPYLLAILDWIVSNAETIQELVLLGDVVDMWTYPFDTVPPTFAEIVEKHPMVFSGSGGLARVLDALDGNVTYVTGNHDMGVTDADVAAITSPGGHRLRFCEGSYHPGGDTRVLLAHGNAFTLYNAPDHATKWAPLPVGHFITRIVATHWQTHLAPGQNVAQLADQGYPNGLDWRAIVKNVVLTRDLSIADALLDGVAGQEGVSETAPIKLADGSSTNLVEVKAAYRDLFTNWVNSNGGGEDGLLVAGKAAVADFDAHYMGWFAQREAFLTGAELVVMGHTHAPISGLTGSFIDYVNSGFECPSSPDMTTRAVSFVVIDTDSATAEVMQVSDSAGTMVFGPCPAPTAAIVSGPTADFSCYAVIDNTANSSALTLVASTIGHGHFVTLPHTIAAGSKATLWLQDYPTILPPRGADAAVTYQLGDGTHCVFNFDCPTGAFPNSVSGGSSFRARSGDGDWLPQNEVPRTGHPLFIEFAVAPGVVDGLFSGSCGENSFAVSSAGLQPTQSAVLNGSTDLSGCMVANDGGAVYGIRLDKTDLPYAYTLSIDARGPAGLFSGSVYLHFTDQTGDRYLKVVTSSTRGIHTLGYNSAAPAIVKIEWSNTL